MTKIYLNDGMYAQLNSGSLFLHLPNDGMVALEEPEQVLDILTAIKGSGHLGIEGVLQEVSAKYEVDQAEFLELLEPLIAANVVKVDTADTATLSERSMQKYDRQIRSFATRSGCNISAARDIQRKIESSHVAILGVGGVGSYVGFGLANMGIGTLSLFDFDHIELSNTSRQMLYQEHDVGRSKLDVAREKLLAANPDLKVNAHNIRVTGPEMLAPFLKDVDFLILAADTPRGEIVYHAAAAAAIAGSAFAFAMPTANTIVCGPMIIPGETRSYGEIFPRPPTVQNDSVDYLNSGFVATIIDPCNAIAAKMVTLECLKQLTSFSKPAIIDHVFVLNTDSWALTKTEV